MGVAVRCNAIAARGLGAVATGVAPDQSVLAEIQAGAEVIGEVKRAWPNRESTWMGWNLLLRPLRLRTLAVMLVHEAQ